MEEKRRGGEKRRQEKAGRLGVFCEFCGGEKAIHFGRASFVISLIRISFSLSILSAELEDGKVGKGRKKDTLGNEIERKEWRENGGTSFVFLSFPMLFYLWEKIQTCYFEFVLSEHDITKTRVFIGVAEE